MSAIGPGLQTRSTSIEASCDALRGAVRNIFRRLYVKMELGDIAYLTIDDWRLPVTIDGIECEAFVAFWEGEGTRLDKLYLQVYPISASAFPKWAQDLVIFVLVRVTQDGEQLSFEPDPLVAYGNIDDLALREHLKRTIG